MTDLPDQISFPSTDAQIFELENGLTVILKEDHSAPVVSLQAWVETGSIHEGDLLGTGVSHALEHMVFKGTKKRGLGQISADVQAAGGYLNAYTTFDRTVYWIDVPSPALAPCLDALTDLVFDATLPASEFESEQEVIRREIAMGKDDADHEMTEMIFSTAFSHHPCRYPVIGQLDLFNRLTQKDLVAYHQKHYTAGNTFFVLAGDFDSDRVIAQMRELIVDLPRVPPCPEILAVEPRQLGQRNFEKEFATPNAKIALAWKIPPVHHPDSPALDLLSTILGDGRSSRMYQAIREDLGLAYDVDFYCFSPTHDGLMIFGAECDDENVAAVEEEARKLIGQVQADGVGIDELEKAQRKTLAGQIGTLATMSGLAGDLASNWRQARNLNYTKDYLAAIQSVAIEDIRSAAQRYFQDASLTRCVLRPEGKKRSAPMIQTAAAKPEIEKWSFDNGLTVLVRDDRRVPLVSLAATFRAGLLAESEQTNGITSLCGKSLLKGTRNRSAEEIFQQIENRGGGIHSAAGNNSLGIRAGVLAPDLSFGIELLGDVVQNATFPQPEVDRERDAMIASVEEKNTQPFALALKNLRRELFAGSQFAMERQGTVNSLQSITADALAGYREHYFQGANGVLSVFGDLSKISNLKDELAATFGGLARGERHFEDAPNRPSLLESRWIEAELPKEQAVIAIGFLTDSVTSKHREELDVLDEACSDMASHLFMRIREELGLAYYVGTTQMLGLHTGGFLFYVGTSAAQAALAEKELLAEIKRLAEGGMTEHEFARARSACIGKETIEMQTNSAISSAVSLDELFGLGHLHQKRSLERLSALTVDDLRQTCAKFFANRPFVGSRVLPKSGR